MSTPIDISSPDDPLNDPFDCATTLKEVVDLYLKKADSLHLDALSGGDRERVTQLIKYIIALASPSQD